MKTKVLLCCMSAVALSALLLHVRTDTALADTPHSGTIGSQTWSSSDNVHIITDHVIVDVGETLTIEEGVIVKFELGRSLIINGSLRVLGTSGNPVYFTSIRDDTVGGDTDNSATAPARGDWYQIQFGDNSDDATSLIDHAVIRYGGRTYGSTVPDTYYGAITLVNASPTIQNSTIQDSLNYAYRATLCSFPTLTNNTLINNGINGIAITSDIYGSTLNCDATWSITDTAYYLRNTFSVGTDKTLTIGPGVVIKFGTGQSLFVTGANSALGVLGTDMEPVHITSIRDDTVGGDTDNSATAPARGNWRRIEFGDNSDDATSLIDHAVIRYGGGTYGSTVPDTYYGAITLVNASPTIQNSTIQDSLNYAYRATLCSFPTLTNNTLINNGINGIAITSDVYGSTINCDATWSITDTAYYLRNTFSVGTDKTLTIGPGVVIKFGTGQSLFVTGANSALRVLGTDMEPVRFTSIRDDTVGGDTDNSATAPARGNWRRIEFGDNSDDATSLIDHAVIRYGGGTYGSTVPDTYYGAITLVNASPTIQNSTIQDSLNYAYRATLCSFPTLTNNELINNGINGIASTNDVYGSVIDCDATWSITDTSYYLRDTFSVGTDKTLTIDPGVVIKFNVGKALWVTGANSALRVLGTSGDPVHFTSIRDDTVGGDTNNSATAPARGDWYQIQFGDNSDDATSLIDHAVIRYGGRTVGSTVPDTYYGAITMLSASPTIQNSTIQDSLNYAYRATLCSFPTLTNNELINNGINGIAITSDVYGSTINCDATWSITDTAYYLRDTFSVGTDKTLTIDPGVVIKFRTERSLLVTGANSALRVLGTSGDPVRFTSIRDDTVGGDTNNNGSGTVPVRGDWYRIEFGENSDDAATLIDHAIIRYGGRGSYGAITMLSASPTIQNSTICTNSKYGVLANNSTPVLGCNNIYDNGALSGGIRYYGIYNATPSVIVNAQNQWWGSTSGPYHSTNPGGTGNAVSDGVAFWPFRTSPCGTPPASPSGLQATMVSASQIDLTWDDNSSDETEFRVERSLNGVSGWVEIGTVAANVEVYSDVGLSCSTMYYYRVRAYRDGDGVHSEYSNVDSAATQPCSPSALSALAVSRTQIDLTWQDNSTDEMLFYIEQSLNGSTSWEIIASVPADTTEYSNAGLHCGTAYYYRVRAFRGIDGQYSAHSNVSDATTLECYKIYLPLVLRNN